MKRTSQFLAFAYRRVIFSLLPPRGFRFLLWIPSVHVALKLVPLYQLFDQSKRGIAIASTTILVVTTYVCQGSGFVHLGDICWFVSLS